MTPISAPPRGVQVRCMQLCVRPAQLIVTYADASEAALCVDHFLALMRYDTEPFRAVRGVAEPAPVP